MKNRENLNNFIKVVLFCIICVIVSRLFFFAIYHYKVEDPSTLGYIRAYNKWDAGWFGSLIENGYDAEPTGHDAHDAANWAFFPMMPMVCGFFANILHTPHEILAPIINTGIFTVALVIAWYYLRDTRSKKVAYLYVLLAAFGMYTFYFSSIYTESLYLLCIVRFLLCYEERKVYSYGNFWSYRERYT